MNNEINWNDIRSVFLDLDGTLLDLHFDNHFWLKYVPQHYAEKHRMSYEEANEILMQRYSEVRGRLDWYCVDFWTRELELNIEELKHQLSHKIAVHPLVEDFLLAMKRNNKRIVLVTNAHPASLSLKMSKTGLDTHFDEIINAHNIGMAKEHEGFWQKLREVEHYEPENTLLIDDNLEVLRCAEQYGIKYLLAIKRPDSQGNEVITAEYRALNGFDEITPD